MRRGQWRSVFVSIIVCAGVSFFANAANASGNYYVDTASLTASDEQTCQSAQEPCATVNGAIARILESTTPEDSTILFNGTVAEQVEITDASLDGLTLTWFTEGVRPRIDATGNQYGIYIRGVNTVTISHVDVTGPTSTGIAVVGTQDAHVMSTRILDTEIADFSSTNTGRYGISLTNADFSIIKNNTIRNIGESATDAGTSITIAGIYLYTADTTRIQNNTLQNISLTHTSATDTSLFYGYVYGIFAHEADDLLLYDNTLTDISATTQLNAAAPYGVSTTYGLYLSGTNEARVTGNMIKRVAASTIGVLDTSAAYAYAYGIYGWGLNNGRMTRQRIRRVSATTQVQDTEISNSAAYGMSVNTSDTTMIANNEVSNVSTHGVSGRGSAITFGMHATDMRGLDVLQNTSRSTHAQYEGSGIADVRAMYFIDTPNVNIIRNRLADFTATASSTSTFSSAGIALHYNSAADIVNNLIYHTRKPAGGVDGILLASAHTTPVRIYHNTLSNLNTCFDIDDMGVVEVFNTICHLQTNGASVYEFTSERADVQQLQSDANAFYTTNGTLHFTDVDTKGEQVVRTLAEWKALGFDTSSINRNPRLVLDKTKKQFLHLRKGSPLINATNKNANLPDDATTQKRLQKDWDHQLRPRGKKPDIGADEYYP